MKTFQISLVGVHDEQPETRRYVENMLEGLKKGMANAGYEVLSSAFVFDITDLVDEMGEDEPSEKPSKKSSKKKSAKSKK